VSDDWTSEVMPDGRIRLIPPAIVPVDETPEYATCKICGDFYSTYSWEKCTSYKLHVCYPCQDSAFRSGPRFRGQRVFPIWGDEIHRETSDALISAEIVLWFLEIESGERKISPRRASESHGLADFGLAGTQIRKNYQRGRSHARAGRKRSA